MRIRVHDRLKVPSRNLTNGYAQLPKLLGDISSPTTRPTVAFLSRLSEVHLEQTTGSPLHHLLKAVSPHDELALRRGITTRRARTTITARR
jgi:hypothetical protein